MNFIDLFAGAGGLSEGFIRAGFNPIVHVEIDEAACFTLKTRMSYHYLKKTNQLHKYDAYLKGEIDRKHLYSLIPEKILNSVIHKPIGNEFNEEIFTKIDSLLEDKTVDFIIGGPPCQAYSLVGRSRSENNMKGDERNYLYVQYAKYLERYSPNFFVFENVIGLKSAGKGIYLLNMKKLFFKKGYTIKLFTLDAVKFGVLQNRKRVVIIGWKNGLSFDVPDFENIIFDNKYKVGDIFTDLPPLQAGQGKDKSSSYVGEVNEYLTFSGIRGKGDILTQHIARPHNEQDKEIYRIVNSLWHENKTRLNYNSLPEHLKTHANRTSFFDRFKVVASELPYSQTVVAHIAKDGHYYIHPDINQNRSISVREAARLQSFPDNFYFEGVKEGANRTASFKQIGNAVPPIMAYAIASKMKEKL